MPKFMTKNATIFFLLMTLIFTLAPAVSAGEITLSVNSGNDNTVWFITGEQTLVINGFDLTSVPNLTLPAQIDRVSIDVNTPVPGANATVVIYEDPNGGSPVDARLVSQNQVQITESGRYTYTLSEPVTITSPVVWIGFYLPVDFHFHADTSGSSVLTYWGWTSGGTFSLNDLSTAGVFGPSDGSAPVNINLGGKARITAEITSGAADGTTPPPAASDTPSGGQGVDMSVMRPYSEIACAAVLKDYADINISLQGRVSTHCSTDWVQYAPSAPAGYFRRGQTYEISMYLDDGRPVSDFLDAKITHCLRPAAEDLNRAVIGYAYGSPRTWNIRPTLRFGDFVCAEIGQGGYLAYFVPSGS